MGLKEKYAYKKIQKLQAGVKRAAQIPDLNKIKRIGVIWLPNQAEALEYLRSYFIPKQVIFRSLCFNNVKKTETVSSNEIIASDLTWWGLPKPEKCDEFLNTDFDLLLDLSMERSLVTDYLNALSRARFKIGYAETEANYFDLNINIGKKRDALYLAQQQIFYLAQLNQKEDK